MSFKDKGAPAYICISCCYTLTEDEHLELDSLGFECCGHMEFYDFTPGKCKESDIDVKERRKYTKKWFERQEFTYSEDI